MSLPIIVEMEMKWMSMDIDSILNGQDRVWTAQGPASKSAIERLRHFAPDTLPDEYFALLRFSNGGEGPVDLPPLYFQLYDAEYAIERNQNSVQYGANPGFFVFGSNGGLETIAFDMRQQKHCPIVMFDAIEGPESAVIIAMNISDFIRAIGIDRNRFQFRIAEAD